MLEALLKESDTMTVQGKKHFYLWIYFLSTAFSSSLCFTNFSLHNTCYVF